MKIQLLSQDPKSFRYKTYLKCLKMQERDDVSPVTMFLTHIYYRREPDFAELKQKYNTWWAAFEMWLKDDFEFVVGLRTVNKELTYHFMQGEVWSPLGEARQLITECGLKHTSMSVGDIMIVHQADGRYAYGVDYEGFSVIAHDPK